MPRIDAHHHLWRYSADEYGWIDDSMAALRRDFLLEDLCRELRSANLDATVAVQARQTVEETEWLLGLAAPSATGSPIAGVVGWLPLAAPEIEALLEDFASREALRGLRHVVQAEPAGFLEGEAFNRGVRALRGTGLVYDILILFVQKELDILGSRNALPEDFREVIAMLEAGRFPVDRAVSAIVGIEEAPAMLAEWSASPAAFTKIMVKAGSEQA